MSLWEDMLQKEPKPTPKPDPVEPDTVEPDMIGALNVREVGVSIRMAGTVFRNADKTFVCLFPWEQEQEGDVEMLEMDLDAWRRFLRQTDVLEVEVLAEMPDGKIAKTVLRKSQRQISQGVSWAVYKRDNYCCRYCGKDGIPMTVDHLVLWEHGGPSIVANLVSACRKCNKVRGNMEYAPWLQSDHYRKVSPGLTPEVREANQAVLATLDAIPRHVHKPKSR
jgi:hypothetical protein